MCAFSVSQSSRINAFAVTNYSWIIITLNGTKIISKHIFWFFVSLPYSSVFGLSYKQFEIFMRIVIISNSIIHMISPIQFLNNIYFWNSEKLCIIFFLFCSDVRYLQHPSINKTKVSLISANIKCFAVGKSQMVKSNCDEIKALHWFW